MEHLKNEASYIRLSKNENFDIAGFEKSLIKAFE
jgi:hypothetical protein